MTAMDPSENEYGDDPRAEEVLAEAAAIVDRGHQLLRHERTMRRVCRALERLGLTAITGGAWAHLDEDKAEIVFNPIQVDLMLVNRLEDLVELIETLQRVPAPVTVGGIHIHHVEQLLINYQIGTQPPTTG